MARDTEHPSWRLLAAGLSLAAVVAASTAVPLRMFTSLWVLAGLATLNLVVLALRVVDMWFALHRLELREPDHGRRRRAHQRSTATRRLAGAVVGAILVTHAVAGVQLHLARVTLVEAFPLASQPRAPQPTESGTRLPDAGGQHPEPGFIGPDGFIDVLLVGLDAGAGREGARNDANMVVRVSPTTAEVLLVGVPRNMVRVPMPSSRDACACFRLPLYALYGHGVAHPGPWPDELDPGAAAVRDSLASLLGVTIDRYVVADMGAFLDLVDVMGGVDVPFTTAMADDKSHPFDETRRVSLDVGPGVQHLDGSQALTFARSRHHTDDYERMQRQRCLVGALSTSASHLGAGDVLRLSRSVRGRLVSDIPRDELPDFVGLVQRVDADAIDSLGLVPPQFTNGYEDGYPLADRDAVQEAVRAWPARNATSDVASACP